MPDEKRTMNQNKTHTSDKKWRLILVGHHGSVIPLGAVKTLLILLVLTLVVTVGCAIVLGVLYVRQKVEFSSVVNELEQKEAQVQTLRDKRDMLLARLVITESKLNAEDNRKAEPEQKTSSNSPQSVADTDEGAPAWEKESPDLKEAAADNAPAPISVSISDFKITHDPQKKEILASYRLKNTTPGDTRIGGKCVLLLKGTINGEVTNYPIPNVPWENGRPSARLGRPFFIRNFMTLQLSRSAPEQRFSFDRGIVYVFETKGTVLLKKEIPIDLSYVEENVPPKTQTSTKNSKDSEEEADIKNTPVENELRNPAGEPAESESLP